MGSAAPLRLVEGFFGVDEALTDYRRGSGAWAATLIATGTDVEEAGALADEAVRELARGERLELAPEPDNRVHTEAT
jgi:hypothetical protein